MKLIPQEEAMKQDRFGRLTTAYELPNEQGMLDNTIADMRRGNIEHIIVDVGDNPGRRVEVWRTGIKKAR